MRMTRRFHRESGNSLKSKDRHEYRCGTSWGYRNYFAQLIKSDESCRKLHGRSVSPSSTANTLPESVVEFLVEDYVPCNFCGPYVEENQGNDPFVALAERIEVYSLDYLVGCRGKTRCDLVSGHCTLGHGASECIDNGGLQEGDCDIQRYVFELEAATIRNEYTLSM